MLARALQSLQMAEKQTAVAVVQMHTVTLAVAEEGTVSTEPSLHPAAVAEGLETMLPYVHEIVAVNVALVVIGTDAGTGGNGTVCQDRGHTDAGVTGIETIAYLTLVIAEKALAAVTDTQFAFVTGTGDEVHQPLEVAIIQLKLGIVGGTPHGKDGEQTPAADTGLIEDILQLLQTKIVTAVDTSHHVPLHVPLLCQQANGIHRTVVAVGMAAQPIMVIGKAVKTDGDGVKPCGQETLQPFGGKKETIGHHSPRITAAVKSQAHLLQVVAYQRFTTRNDDVHLMRIDVRRQAVHHTQKVLGRHIGNIRSALAITTTMFAMDVAPLCAFPKELLQRMQSLLVLPHPAEYLQCQTLAQGKPFYRLLHGCCRFSNSKFTS